MIAKIKLALRIATNSFDAQILDLIQAALADIALTGAYISDKYTAVTSRSTVTDYTITNVLLRQAVITYCCLNFGAPENYDKLKASYDEQKAQIRENTDFAEPEPED